MIGAVIQLGNCFDLLDTRNTALLRDAFGTYQEQATKPFPQNRGPFHRLDCAVLNFAFDHYAEKLGLQYHSVRGVFQEGAATFEGSDIREKSHIQIAVRDTACILGYFKPQLR